MSTQETLAGLGHSLTNKKFKYVLSTRDYGNLTLTHAPEGWKDSELMFIRDEEYKGVLTQISTDDLTFIKEGRDYIQTAYEAKGIDYEITINIYLLNNSTFQYQSYFTGKIDLSSYRIDSIGVTVKIENIGFQDVVLNRDSIDVDLMNTKFIGGGNNSMEQISNMPLQVALLDYSATQNADWDINGTLNNLGTGYTRYLLPMTLNFSEYDSAETSNQTFAEYTEPPTGKFFDSDSERTVNFKLNATINLTSHSTPGTFTLNLWFYKNDTVVQVFTPDTTLVSGITTQFTFEVEQTVTLVAGDKLRIAGYSNGTISYYVFCSDSSLSISEDLGIELQAINPYMFAVYEAFVRNLQLISGKASPFYSDFLGRTDSSPDTYASDGDGALMTLTIGKWIRQFNIAVNGINMSLKDLFKTINGVYNVGLGFETISGDNKVRVEKERHFFDVDENPDYSTDGLYWKVNQILDLSSWLNNEMISKEVLPDWYANEVEGGYQKYEYENYQGLKEFNTQSNWAIPVRSVKKTLDLKSEYRADTQGINKLREKPQSEFPTEDVTGDNDIFIFDVKRNVAGDFVVKKDEDFSNVVGGVDPEQSYNLNLTPRRNLERHGNRFRSMQIDLGKELQWMRSDKNTKLQTRLTSESELKSENGDIQLSTLEPGYWIPEAYSFEAPVTLATITAIQDNPYGVIKIASDKWGWILEVQTNSETKKGDFKLLKVDTENVKIID